MNQLKFAVVGMVNNNGHILIGKKTAYKEDDVLSEKWHIPGGGVRDGERLPDAIEREIHEEFGINVKASRIIDVKLVRKPQHEFVAVVWIECTPLDTKISLSDEIFNAKWIPKNAIFKSLDKEAVDLFPPLVHKYFLS